MVNLTEKQLPINFLPGVNRKNALRCLMYPQLAERIQQGNITF